MAIACVYDLHIYAGDWVAAFLQSPVHEKHLYGKFPKGFTKIVNGVEMCMHFQKALYGMVQAARNWFHHVRSWLMTKSSFKFKQMGSNQCVFHAMVDGELCITFLYVDDLGLLTTSHKIKERLFKEIKDSFDFEDKGEMKYF